MIGRCAALSGSPPQSRGPANRQRAISTSRESGRAASWLRRRTCKSPGRMPLSVRFVLSWRRAPRHWSSSGPGPHVGIASWWVRQAALRLGPQCSRGRLPSAGRPHQGRDPRGPVVGHRAARDVHRVPGPMSASTDIHGTPKRVLMLASNPSVSPTTGWPIGFWWAELTHPYWEFVEAGYEVTLASPDGGTLQADSFSDPGTPPATRPAISSPGGSSPAPPTRRWSRTPPPSPMSTSPPSTRSSSSAGRRRW